MGRTACISQQITSDETALIRRIADPDIRAGVEDAVVKNVLSAAIERQYPGHFTASADGVAYGDEGTWPGLDSWQLAGAYLLLGRTRLVLDYFEFVRASQRKDGNIPCTVVPAHTPAEGFMQGLKYPQDVFTYRPPKREGLPASSQETRQWISLFEHWQPKAGPLGATGSICHILTAAEIFDVTGDLVWLRERRATLEAAARFLLSRKGAGGLVGGSAFYLELPPRYGWDGVTQCYTIHAFRQLAALLAAAGDQAASATWSAEADRLAATFVATFWRGDHFAEYVHAERGLVDAHGLSDTNWAAVAFGVADERHLERLWPRLMGSPEFWWGGMPTQLVTKPFAYETWEYHEPLKLPVAPLNDVAAMGRVWYLEATACRRMGERERLVESVRRVCRARGADGHWRERYPPQADGSVLPAAVEKYCEYPAVLVRVVLGNPDVFLA